MTINEYITMDLLLPMALGLAGAALYHLIGAFLRWAFIGYATDKVATVGQLDSYQNYILAKITYDRTRLDALEERMGKVEEEQAPRTATEAMIRSEGRRTHRWASAEDLETVQIWPGATSAVGDYGPYGYAGIAPTGSGKPCPKPTKDLRPGDEVSVKVKVKTIGADFIAVDWYPLSHTNCEDLDKLRTDNKE